VESWKLKQQLTNFADKNPKQLSIKLTLAVH